MEEKSIKVKILYTIPNFDTAGSGKALLNIAIGQGEILSTPIQMSNYVNLIATNGDTYPVHLVKSNINKLYQPEADLESWKIIKNVVS